MEKSLVYEATISTSTGPFKYIGISESNFKIRYNNHQNSFRNRKYQNITELSKKVWELKDNNQSFTISWKKLQGTDPFTPGKKKCNLCVTEKLYIIKHKVKLKEKLLYKKSEIISKCRHENKYKLRNIKRHNPLSHYGGINILFNFHFFLCIIIFPVYNHYWFYHYRFMKE